jgi:YlmC/YmxH family sporulation protein
MKMMSYFSELKYKEVIDVHTGFRLGYVCDMEFDDREGRIVSLITPGRPRFFGLLGREDDYVLPWGCIVRVGNDIILVEAKGEFMRRKRQGRLF